MAFPMKELDVHNGLLDDPKAMAAQMKEEGYLFFRDVLDRDAVEQVRQKYFSVLIEDYGVVDPGQTVPLWNGKDVSGFPIKVPEVYGSGTYEKFVGNPRIHAFFEKVMGEPISWIPSTEYRLNPPVPEDPEDWVAGRHQDGFFNDGVPFWTAWCPFADIGPECGGLAIAPGANKRGYLHDRNDPPKYGIPADAIKESEWARPETYHAGDVLIFGEDTPHSGLANRSGVFRLSMDIRFSAKSDPQPVVGTLSAVETGRITIDTADGPVTLRVDDRSYLRLKDGAQLPVAEMENFLQVGEKMMAGRDGDRALVVRPQKG
ncbi:phytanoyl-CoA dioxygenase family protein [Pseudonocardia sp. NPDC049154]|uniref:phytanoyl-CoA dioxygenase family protein n=1 Tax=Pseudonocardia sp. NPDC049154 TaxID=3155501 RepID=UPI0033D4320A